jgi:hypothetical protein
LKIEELPKSMTMGLSADRNIIADALRMIVSGKKFTHVAIVHGESRSGRVLLTKNSFDAVSLPRPFSPDEMADELFRLGREEARYDSSSKIGFTCKKGWEIKMAMIDGSPVAIALAAWV